MKAIDFSAILFIFFINSLSLFADEDSCGSDTTIYTPSDSIVSYPTFVYKDSLDVGSLKKFYIDNLRFPRDIDCEGTVVVQVVVEKNGSLTNICIRRGLPGCIEFDNEALRLVRLMDGLWLPAKNKKGKIRLTWLIPVFFRIYS